MNAKFLVTVKDMRDRHKHRDRMNTRTAIQDAKKFEKRVDDMPREYELREQPRAEQRALI